MRHRVQAKQFNRDTNSRKALFVNLVRSLIENGSVVTTREKAKEVRRIADKLIHKAQTDTLESRRNLHQFFGKRDVVNTLTTQVAPAMSDRVSGFTTISLVGKRRGDNTQMIKLELMTKHETVGSLKKPKAKNEKPKTKKITMVEAEVKKELVAKKVAPKKATPVKKVTSVKKAAPKKVSPKRKVSK